VALARCENHRPRPFRYGGFALPIGFPNTAAICGRARCEAPAYIWLTASEARDHARGIRIFTLPNSAATKLRVSDDPISRWDSTQSDSPA